MGGKRKKKLTMQIRPTVVLLIDNRMDKKLEHQDNIIF